MTKIIFSTLALILAGFSFTSLAQDTPKAKTDKEAQEIIIRKKGNKDANLNIQITGDKVTINGKPLIEFKDDEITVNNKRIMVRDGNGLRFYDGPKSLGSMSWAKARKAVYLGVSTEKTDDGAKITDVVKNSPADKAGLKEGDIITKLDEKNIDGPQSLFDAVNSKKEKEEVKISYKREKKDKTVKAVLQKRSGDDISSFSFTTPNGDFKTFAMPPMPHMDMEQFERMERNFDGMGRNFETGLFRKPKLGLKIQDTEDAAGVKIIEVEDSSAAAKAGLKKDDIITMIGTEKINNTDEARSALAENTQKTSFPVKAKRNGSEINFDLKFPKKLKTASL